MDRIGRTIALLQDFSWGNVEPGEMVAHMADLAGAQSGWLVLTDPSGAAMPFGGHRLPPDIFGTYVRHYAERDVQVQALIRRYGDAPPALVTDEDAMPYRDFIRSELFNGLFQPHGVHRMLRMDGQAGAASAPGALKLMVCRDHDRAFAAPDLALFCALLPHFRNASLHWTAARARAWGCAAALFENTADAISILDADGTQHYANTAFETLRRRIEPGSRWRSPRPLEAAGFKEVQRIFQAGLRHARDTGFCARQAHVVLPESTGARRHAVAVSALMAGTGITAARGRVFVLVLRELQAFEDERIESMRRRYGLTPAQIKVLRELMDGRNQNEIAERLALSVHTVRLHVKSLLTKTGCRRQAELIQLVEKSPGQGLRLLI